VREKATPRGDELMLPRPQSASAASLRTAGLANSASAQSLGVRKASPAYGFGAASRAVANKLFVSQQHTLTLMHGTESPGPSRYSLPAVRETAKDRTRGMRGVVCGSVWRAALPRAKPQLP